MKKEPVTLENHLLREDQELRALLSARKCSEPGTDFVERIMFAARTLPQASRQSVLSWVFRLCEEFHLRRPAYTVAALFIVGFIMGFGGDMLENLSSDSIGVQDGFYDDGGAL